jgi:RNA polymerase sigma-70 factor (ECF subfamily)
MREILEQLLQAVDVPNPERAQLLWDEYRTGADSTDPAVKNAADAAFATLLAWHGGGLYRHIWGFIRSDAAEDVFQDVLRKLHQKRLSPRLADFNGSVLPWLRRVAIHESIDAHRRASRRRGRESRAARPEEEQHRGNSGELQEMLAVALAQLSREEREAIALHYFEGLDRQQAAQILGIHRVTLGKRLSHALTRLQKLIPVPVGILVGAMPGIPTALTARPPELSAARLGELVTAAFAKASGHGVSFGKAAAVVLLGLTFCGGLAAAGWALTREPHSASVPAPLEQVEPPRGSDESLQDKHIRLMREDVVPLILRESQKLFPADNPLRVVDVRAFGSEIECEFRTERPIDSPIVPTGLRLRYCVLTRRMEIMADEKGNGEWYAVNPDRPIYIDLPIPGLPIRAIELGKEQVAAVRAAFERLLPDERAESEQVRWLFGSDEKELFLPVGSCGFYAEAGQLYFVDRKFGLFIREPGKQWRYGGVCPGWWIVAEGGRLFCTRGNEILTRREDARDAPWRRWGDFPPLGTGERGGFLTIGGDRLIAAVHPHLFYFRPLAAPTAPWARQSSDTPVWPDGIAATSERLYGHNTRNLLSRPLHDPAAPWAPVARQPDGCTFLAVDGDRLLAFGGEPGPIYARPLAAVPAADWTIVGRVHEPRER